MTDGAPPVLYDQVLAAAIRRAQQRVVKIYGAGGFSRMEAYQSGTLISPEGHVLTFMSYVFDTDEVTVVTDDGQRFTAELVGADPLTELAVLKIAPDGPLPWFDLSAAASAPPGTPVLAVSNLYGIATGDEPVSALQGVVTALAQLDARRGGSRVRYHGPIVLVDASTNNPGASGGALVDWRGNLVGVIGKELRSRATGTWLNYAVPADRAEAAVEAILNGATAANDTNIPAANPLRPLDLGFRLVPDVLPRTPPFVDWVSGGSSAYDAGLRVDDLVVFISGAAVNSCAEAHELLGNHDRRSPLTVSVLREGELLQLRLEPPTADSPREPTP